MPTATKKPRKPKKARAAAVVAVASEETIVAFKGFDKDFQCRGFQFEVGKTYEHDGKVEACESGFHACEHPLHVWQYYKPSASRFARVTLGGKTSRHSDDTKIAAARITIDAEVSISDLAVAAVKWVFSRAKWKEGAVEKEKNEGATASGYCGAATASGYCGAATASGDSGAATASGDYGAATASGYYGAATASGYSGAATASGYSGAATASGYYGAATASGDSGAATASGYYGAATASGYSGAATASGYYGAATASGYYGAATASGYYGAATASGYSGKARGKEGCALFLAERDSARRIINVWAGIVGKDGVKPDTFYTLRDGKPVEV